MIRDLKTLYSLALPARGQTHSERMENFYKNQASHYDEFRKKLLKGREPLFQKANSQCPRGHWVDVGSGTAPHLDFLTAPQLSQYQTIDMVDASPSLLEQAKKRMLDKGLKNTHCHPCDVHQWQPCAPVDLVTFSYSLTMIPHWPVLLEKVWQWLKPEGVLAIVDFYVSEKYPQPGYKKHSRWQRHFWPLWFSHDNVRLSQDHLPYLLHKFNTLELFEGEHCLPYLPLARVPYYCFIGQKRQA